MIRRYFLLCAVAFIVCGLDQIAKKIITDLVPAGASVEIVPGFFDLVNIRNRGAAFGFLNRSDIEWQFWLFLAATLVAVIAIFFLVRDARKNSLIIGLGMILGGALGNLLDRIRYRSVADFLDFYWRDWHWPAFNVADMAICCGAFLTCLAIWRKGQMT